MTAEVTVNGRFEGRKITGVDRYASEILRCLGTRVKVISPTRSLTGVRGHLWEQFILPLMIPRKALLWSPANSGPLAVTRQVVTIHDVGVLDHPEWFAPIFRFWYSILFPVLAQRVRVVLTVSQYSRRSILDKFNLPEKNVIVCPNGVNQDQFHPCDARRVIDKYGVADSYVLFVGSIDPRKNLARLLQAWEQLNDFPDAQLVIAGSKGSIFRESPALHASERVRHLGYVPEQDLPALYSGATLFVMPSLFEGFGLTVLEAMACGTPVITSNAGALPEVSGDAAVLVDPASVVQLNEAMRALLSDAGLRLRLREKGLERVCLFSWESSAEQIWEVLEQHD